MKNNTYEQLESLLVELSTDYGQLILRWQTPEIIKNNPTYKVIVEGFKSGEWKKTACC